MLNDTSRYLDDKREWLWISYCKVPLVEWGCSYTPILWYLCKSLTCFGYIILKVRPLVLYNAIVLRANRHFFVIQNFCGVYMWLWLSLSVVQEFFFSNDCVRSLPFWSHLNINWPDIFLVKENRDKRLERRSKGWIGWHFMLLYPISSFLSFIIIQISNCMAFKMYMFVFFQGDSLW